MQIIVLSNQNNILLKVWSRFKISESAYVQLINCGTGIGNFGHIISQTSAYLPILYGKLCIGHLKVQYGIYDIPIFTNIWNLGFKYQPTPTVTILSNIRYVDLIQLKPSNSINLHIYSTDTCLTPTLYGKYDNMLNTSFIIHFKDNL